MSSWAKTVTEHGTTLNRKHAITDQAVWYSSLRVSNLLHVINVYRGFTNGRSHYLFRELWHFVLRNSTNTKLLTPHEKFRIVDLPTNGTDLTALKMFTLISKPGSEIQLKVHHQCSNSLGSGVLHWCKQTRIIDEVWTIRCNRTTIRSTYATHVKGALYERREYPPSSW